MKTVAITLSMLLMANLSADFNVIRKEKDKDYPKKEKDYPAAYSAPSRYDVVRPHDFFFKGSFTYWIADQEGTEIGYYDTDNSNETGTASTTIDKIVEIDSGYKPAFKLMAGINFEKDNWVMYFNYDYYRAKNSNAQTQSDVSTADNGENLLTYWANLITNVDIRRLYGQWRLRMDMFALNLSRPFFSGEQYTINSYFGLRSGIINQRYVAKIRGFNVDFGFATLADNEAGKARSESWYIGPTIGAEGNWNLGYGIKFLGNVEGSVVYQDFSTHYEQKFALDFYPFVADTFEKRIQRDESFLTTYTKLSLGLGWSRYFCKNKFLFELEGLYDFQSFGKQNTMFSLVHTGSFSSESQTGTVKHISNFNPIYGNLTIHGLTLSARFQF